MPNLTVIIQSRRLSILGHIARMDDDADAKLILTAPLQRTGRDHQGIPVSRGWTPSSETWEPTTLHWMKQSIWLRTALCGGWCLRMALCTPSGACQKRRNDVKRHLFKSLPECMRSCRSSVNTSNSKFSVGISCSYCCRMICNSS